MDYPYQEDYQTLEMKRHCYCHQIKQRQKFIRIMFKLLNNCNTERITLRKSRCKGIIIGSSARMQRQTLVAWMLKIKLEVFISIIYCKIFKDIPRGQSKTKCFVIKNQSSFLDREHTINLFVYCLLYNIKFYLLVKNKN